MQEIKCNETEGHYLGIQLEEEIILSIVNSDSTDDRKSIPISKDKINDLIEMMITIDQKCMG